MLFQIAAELPNLARHTDNIIERENFKAPPNSFEAQRLGLIVPEPRMRLKKFEWHACRLREIFAAGTAAATVPEIVA
jgi:hypothetical protein